MSVITGYNFVEPGRNYLTIKDADFYKKLIAKEVSTANKEMKEAKRLEKNRQQQEQLAKKAQDEKSRVSKERRTKIKLALKELRQILEMKKIDQQRRSNASLSP